MDECDNYLKCNSAEIEFNEESDDSSVSSNSVSPQRTARYTLIRNENAKKTNMIYRRVSNYTRQNKSIRKFLLIFGFASTIIILSQIYISLYIDGTALGMSLDGWDRNRSRSTSFYILPNVNTTILGPSNLCQENIPILLLIVIFSATDNFELRQTIRTTWANTTEFNYDKFDIIHSHLKDTYLPINYPDWKNYTIRNNHKNPTESSHDSIENASFRNTDDDPSHAQFQIKTVFLIGQTDNNETQEQLAEESSIYNDLVQESFSDHYNNLTLKSVMMLKWVTNNCAGKVKFVMKCDDDTFVNVPNLIHFLLGGSIPVYNATLQRYNDQTVRVLSPRNRLQHFDDVLIGFRFCGSKPVSDYRSKWFTPRYMWDKRIFPNYLSGAGYVFSMDVAEKLYNASLVSPLLHLEDVYITGICAEKAKIKPQTSNLFNYLPYKELCEVRGMFTSHEIKTSDDITQVYDFVLKSSVTCPAPSRRDTMRLPKRKKSQC